MELLAVGDIMREALYVTLKIALPMLLVTLSVGMIVSLLQALTQIQEQSLTFVPKMIALFFFLIFIMPFVQRTLIHFSQGIFMKITQLG